MTESQQATTADDFITVLDPKQELPSIVRNITADRLIAIIEQSENGDTRDLFALYRDIISSDNHIMSEFGKRKSAILGDPVNVIPFDKKDPNSIRSKDVCAAIIDSKKFADMQQWLLNATLFPVAVCEKIFEPSKNGFVVKDIIPVHYQLLDYTHGDLRIFDVSHDGKPQSTSHIPDANRYIIHRGHTMPCPDTWGGPMRSILFWWLLRTMSRQWWANFLERFGVPFLKGKYSDEEGRKVLVRAFQMAVKLGAIVVSKSTEAEVIQTAISDSSNSHKVFIELCNAEISKLIVGQTLSSTPSPTGELGAGTANLQGQVRDDIRKMDARLLALTIRDCLFKQLTLFNGITVQPPILLFGSDSVSELKSMVTLIKDLKSSGLEPDDDGLSLISERVGFTIRRSSNPPSFLPMGAVGLSANKGLGVDLFPGSERLSQALGQRRAYIINMINSSTSPEDCIQKVREFCLANKITPLASVLEDSLAIYAYNGAVPQP